MKINKHSPLISMQMLLSIINGKIICIPQNCLKVNIKFNISKCFVYVCVCALMCVRMSRTMQNFLRQNES